METKQSSATRIAETGHDMVMLLIESLAIISEYSESGLPGLQVVDSLTKLRDEKLEREVREAICDEAIRTNNWVHANRFLEMV